MRKILNILKIILIVLMLFLLQVSFVSGFSAPFYYWQIFLSFITAYLFVFEKNSYFIMWVIIFGMMLNFSSVYPIFIIPLCLVSVIFIEEFSLNNFVANRSWISLLLLSLIITIIFNVLLFAVKYLLDIYTTELSNISLTTFSFNLLWQIIFNGLGSIMFFIIFRKIIKIYG